VTTLWLKRPTEIAVKRCILARRVAKAANNRRQCSCCHYRQQKLLGRAGPGPPTFDSQGPRQSVKDTHNSFTNWIPAALWVFSMKNIPPDGFFGIQILQNSISAMGPPGPCWGSLRHSPRPPSRLGRGILPPHSPPPSTSLAARFGARV